MYQIIRRYAGEPLDVGYSRNRKNIILSLIQGGRVQKFGNNLEKSIFYLGRN
jgi:hypothetical protein